MNLHEWIRPEKARWREIRARKDYQAVSRGYDELKLAVRSQDFHEYQDNAKFLLASGFRKEASILDAGCGSGDMCRALKEAGFANVTAFDISEENIRSTEPYAGRVFQSTCEKIASEAAQFDAAICRGVIEHVLDVEEALSELHRVLKKDGLLYLTTDNAYWQTIVALKQWFVSKESPRRYNRFVQPIDGDFTPGEIQQLLKEAGFRILRYQGVGGVPIANSILEKVIGPTPAHPILKHFTHLIGILAQKV